MIKRLAHDCGLPLFIFSQNWHILGFGKQELPFGQYTDKKPVRTNTRQRKIGVATLFGRVVKIFDFANDPPLRIAQIFDLVAIYRKRGF